MIIEHLEYSPIIREITEEEQLKELIKDVGFDLHMLGFPVSDSVYNSIFDIIQQGTYLAPKSQIKSIRTVLDLSNAKKLIDNYKIKSGEGCLACKNLGIIQPFPGDTLLYCKLNECEDEIIEKFLEGSLGSRSLKVQKYFEEGCNNKKPFFSKTIETLLKEMSK
jgi:hypothetical protein